MIKKKSHSELQKKKMIGKGRPNINMNFINTIYLLEGIKREDFPFFVYSRDENCSSELCSVCFPLIQSLFTSDLFSFLLQNKKKTFYRKFFFVYTQEKPHFLQLHCKAVLQNVLNYKILQNIFFFILQNGFRGYIATT